MLNNVEKTLEDLKDENLKLKFNSIKSELATLKTEIHRDLELILVQTSKTNSSVAKVMERTSTLEREDNKTRIQILEKKMQEHKKLTEPWTTISSQRWIRVVLIILITMLTLQLGTGYTAIDLIKMLL